MVEELRRAEAARLLVAEDESSIRGLLTGILESEGHAVLAVEDGRAARDAVLGGAEVDVLVTDIQMPRMNGLELIEVLSRERPDLPVVVVTGHGDMDLLIELIRLGCDDFVQKPIRAVELLEKIEQVLEKKRRREEAARRERAELAERQSELAREAEVYARGVNDLRGEIDRAVAAYQDLVQLDPDGYNVPVAWKLQSYRRLGGDYLGIRDTPVGCDVLVADVAGHDLAASYHTVLVKAFFDRNFSADLDGDTFFQVLNRELYDGGRNERMVTALFLRLDLVRMCGELVAAGHPRVARLSAGGETSACLGSPGSVLGVQPEVRLQAETFALSPGDRLLLYTDGLVNAGWVDGPTGERHKLGRTRLMEIAAGHTGKDLHGQVEAVWQEVMDFCRYKQNDDMLLFGLEIPAGLREPNE
ncbi:MAG: PP2C family protein-serine/threonine phosphatase [Desulfovibrionaceae bacterium]